MNIVKKKALLFLLVLQVESMVEGRLWNKIFVWTEQKVCPLVSVNLDYQFIRKKIPKDTI